MNYYVIGPMGGRYNHAKMAEKLLELGIRDAYYHSGGWTDGCVDNVHPHLAFGNYDDAMVFALSVGATVLLTPPVRTPSV